MKLFRKIENMIFLFFKFDLHIFFLKKISKSKITIFVFFCIKDQIIDLWNDNLLVLFDVINL